MYSGCTKGRHSNEKPVDIVKVAAVKEIRPEKVKGFPMAYLNSKAWCSNILGENCA